MACYEAMGASAVTLSPYMGSDSLNPFTAADPSKGEVPTPYQSHHLNGNSRAVVRTEHSLNQWAIGLTRGPFVD